MTQINTSGRHESTKAIVQWFDSDHLDDHLKLIVSIYQTLVVTLLAKLPDSPELTVALRKLLESKDAAVRCAVLKNLPLSGGKGPAGKLEV